ncbi:unnamed protein product [Closterium sp. Naga37s-1]|nr:unnamed protein product [Closterium sp. Naga37s-1]
MGFVSSVLVGLVIGVVIMYAWNYFMAVRQAKRNTVKSDLMAVQGIGLNELKAICGPLCPTWVKFTEYDDADWVTRMLSELWPHINKATSQVVRETMEPILEANRPSIVSSMTFHKFELGKDREKAPHVEGIKLHKTGADKDQVIMDLLIYWQSDASIVLNIKTAAVTLQVQVKNLVFRATLRLIFQLGEQMPCIDAVVASLLRKPRPTVDFVLKAVGGSLAAIPGLEKQIDSTVASVLESVILWPERIVIKLNPAFDEKLLEMKYEGELVVTVVRAEGVKNVDTLGKSDPYTTMWLNPKHMAKTGVCKNNLNPSWNETFLLPVDDPHTAELTIKVEDDDVMQDSDLGWALFPLADLMDKSGPYQVTLDLLPHLHDDKLLGKDHKLGRITLLLAYRDYSDEERDSVTAAEKALLILKSVPLSSFPLFPSLSPALSTQLAYRDYSDEERDSVTAAEKARGPRIKDHSVPAEQANAAMAAAAADSERRVREAAERALMTPRATMARRFLARSMGDLKHRDREGALQVSSDVEPTDSDAAAAGAEGDAPLSPALSPGPDGKPKRRSGAMGFISKVGQMGRNVKSGIEGSLSPK